MAPRHDVSAAIPRSGFRFIGWDPLSPVARPHADFTGRPQRLLPSETAFLARRAPGRKEIDHAAPLPHISPSDRRLRFPRALERRPGRCTAGVVGRSALRRRERSHRGDVRPRFAGALARRSACRSHGECARWRGRRPSKRRALRMERASATSPSRRSTTFRRAARRTPGWISTTSTTSTDCGSTATARSTPGRWAERDSKRCPACCWRGRYRSRCRRRSRRTTIRPRTTTTRRLRSRPESTREYAWTQPGGTAPDVTVCDLEYSWNYIHNDVTKAPGRRSTRTSPTRSPTRTTGPRSSGRWSPTQRSELGYEGRLLRRGPEDLRHLLRHVLTELERAGRHRRRDREPERRRHHPARAAVGLHRHRRLRADRVVDEHLAERADEQCASTPRS